MYDFFVRNADTIFATLFCEFVMLFCTNIAPKLIKRIRKLRFPFKKIYTIEIYNI